MVASCSSAARHHSQEYCNAVSGTRVFDALAVFVFTLDCDNGIYCYGAGDALMQTAAWLIYITL